MSKRSALLTILCIPLLVSWAAPSSAQQENDRPIYMSSAIESEEAKPNLAYKRPKPVRTQEETAEKPPQPEPASTAPFAPPDVYIVINIPATTMTLYEKNEPRIRSKVSVGTGIYPTPESKMSIGHLVWNPWWIPPPSDWAKDEKKTPPGPGNPLGLVKLPMARGYMLHGTNARSSVGRAASHGCMRMYNQDAAELAWYLQSHFSNKTDPKLREKYSKNRRTSYHVKLNKRIPVEIIYDAADVLDGELIIFPDYYGKARWKGKDVLIQTLVNHGIERTSIDEQRVNHFARNWPSLETRIPLHRVVHMPEANRISRLAPVDDRVRLYH